MPIHIKVPQLNIKSTSGGFKYYNFLMSCLDWNINHIFGILTLRAIGWNMNESILRGSLGGGRVILRGCSKILLSHFHKILYVFVSSAWARLIDALVGWFIYGGGLGAWSQKCMECPMVGRGDVFRQNNQQLIPNLQLTYCIYISCMNEGESCFGKGFGWICARNRWSGKSVCISVFALYSSVLHYLARELCRHIAA